ncbi:MAG TPA: hypothetical protein VML55_23090 [Planctomycetaceae bacterium]|nr:hypothetical protein [Planctomycetaceae bacterium]
MKWPVLPILFASMTALFWGLYGPAVGQSRGAFGSPFKPYLWIGVAYLVWGIGGGIAGMNYKGDDFSLDRTGTLWGFIGGSLGAWGALTLTFAMFSFEGPPKPHLVMPIVFGGAVTVTAIASVIQQRGAGLNLNLIAGIIVVAVGIVIVAANTPHAAPHKPVPAESPSPSAAKTTGNAPGG